MKNETILKSKVRRIVATVIENDNKDGFTYYEGLLNDLYSNDPNFDVIKSKMDNLVKLLENVNSKGDEEFEKFESLDFEDIIWYMI